LGATISDVSNFGDATNRLHSGVFGWTKLAGSSFVNEFRLADYNFYNFIGSKADPPELNFPTIVVGQNLGLPQGYRFNRLQIKDDVTFTSGKHLIKIGGEMQRLDSDLLFDLFGSGSVILGEDFATEDLNGDGRIDDNDIPVLFTVRNTAENEPFIPNVDNSYWAFYVQDDWRVTDALIPVSLRLYSLLLMK